MKENFSKGVQRVLKYAKEEAVRLGHSYVGSEHLLLGIIKDTNGKAANILTSIGCDMIEMKNWWVPLGHVWTQEANADF